MEHKMFCYQCQETAGCSGCTQMGVCGKKPEVAAMQDLLVYVSKGLSAVTTQLRKEGTKVSEETNHLITWNLFTTITNANFDNEAIIARIHNTLSVRRTLILQVKDTSGLPEAAFWDIKTKDGSDASDDVLFAKAKEAGVVMTGAGATFPYGKDPKDSNIRIAPSYPTVEELAVAAKLFALCVKLVSVEKILESK